MCHFLLAGLFMCLTVSTTLAADSPANSLLDDWHDKAHDRTLPIKIYYPKEIAGPLPVVIVSHGLGGSREGLKYIGEYWGSHGYIAVHIQHVGSDVSLFKDARPADLVAALQKGANAEQFTNRVNDVKFVIDELTRRNADEKWPLHGKLDLKKIAMTGHSFGAVTTQAICGQIFPGGRSAVDPRIKVGIAFSPSPPRGNMDSKTAFAKVSIPMFHFTGTKDETNPAISPVKAPQRREPFDAMNNSDQFLVVLTDADHGVFGGRGSEGGKARPTDAAWIDLIQRGSTAFLDAYLKGDDKAKKFLDDGEYAGEIKKYGMFEMKLVKAK